MTEPSSNPADRRVIDWLLLPLALFPLIALVTYDWRAIAALNVPPTPSANWIGALGDGFAYLGYKLFGLAIWAVPGFTFLVALLHLTGHRLHTGMRKLWLLVSLLLAAAVVQLVQHHAPIVDQLLQNLNLSDAGGVTGYLLTTRFLAPLLGTFGATVALLAALAMTLVSAVGLASLSAAAHALIRWSLQRELRAAGGDAAAEGAASLSEQDLYLAALKAKADAKHERELERERLRTEKEAAKEAAKAAKEAAKEAARAAKAAAVETSAASRSAAANTTAAEAGGDVPAEKQPYLLPGLTLLNPRKVTEADHGNLKETGQKLIDTLKLFGVNATLSYTVEGPVVTKYALLPEAGTRPEKFTSLHSTLMMALKAKSLRIEAPIPGEDKIGIEVPNIRPAGISFREIFESSAWCESKAELPLLFGKRADGKELVADLASMPHMLVAGATGQGKSVCLNSLICGLLMTRTPEQLKLIMVDPKSVEFTPYASIPHLLVPVITDNRKVVFSLHWAVAEMEKRLKLFARAKVKNIYDFNHRPSFTQTDMFGADTAVGSDMPKTVPYIVIIIDEAADLIGQCGKEVNPDIQRITQKARAAGIHLILATQRPDAKIITGTIKANIPGRVAFKTSQAIDSRTILDEAGAENLIGKGDMLFRGKDGLLIRAQGAWISDEEIARVTSFIEQHSQTEFDEKFSKNLGRVKEAGIEDPFAALDAEDDSSPEAKAEARAVVKAAASASDFKKAVECVINTKRASVSHFQRQMGWGYNHAAKILDMLEARGIVSPAQGAGPRQIVLSQDELVAVLNEGEGGGAEIGAAGEADGEADELFNDPNPNEET